MVSSCLVLFSTSTMTQTRKKNHKESAKSPRPHVPTQFMQQQPHLQCPLQECKEHKKGSHSDVFG